MDQLKRQNGHTSSPIQVFVHQRALTGKESDPCQAKHDSRTHMALSLHVQLERAGDAVRLPANKRSTESPEYEDCSKPKSYKIVAKYTLKLRVVAVPRLRTLPER